MYQTHWHLDRYCNYLCSVVSHTIFCRLEFGSLFKIMIMKVETKYGFCHFFHYLRHESCCKSFFSLSYDENVRLLWIYRANTFPKYVVYKNHCFDIVADVYRTFLRTRDLKNSTLLQDRNSWINVIVQIKVVPAFHSTNQHPHISLVVSSFLGTWCFCFESMHSLLLNLDNLDHEDLWNTSWILQHLCLLSDK